MKSIGLVTLIGKKLIGVGLKETVDEKIQSVLDSWQGLGKSATAVHGQGFGQPKTVYSVSHIRV
jgi:hypothetical protein